MRTPLLCMHLQPSLALTLALTLTRCGIGDLLITPAANKVNPNPNPNA